MSQQIPDLESQLDSLKKQLEELGVSPLSTLTPQQARQQVQQVNKILCESVEVAAKLDNSKINSAIGQIPLRFYTPQGTGPFPVLVYFHGGGWVFGNLDTYDSLCSAIAHQANCIVVSVDYPLAPEHPFPAAVVAGDFATQWVVENASLFNGDSQRIAVGGDSAGGNLATVVARRFRERDPSPLVYQLLIYPVTNLHSLETDSYQAFADDFFLSKNDMIWCRQHYLPTEKASLSPDASPLLVDNCQGLPPTYLVSAGRDVLRDDGLAYAAKLSEAGVSVKCHCYEEMIHGFFTMNAVFGAYIAEASQQIAAELRLAFAA